jgi:spoIIIJ-associated protein
MKDQVFSGPDVAAAKAAAGQALGLSEAALRFVVLDAGAPAGLGITARPARIAVLMAAPGAPAPAVAPAAAAPAGDWQASLGRLLGALSELSGVAVGFRIDESEDAVSVHLEGAREFLLEDDASLVQALEHLFQRAFAERLAKRLVLECEGYRDQREAGLRARARAWAAEVRTSGRPRETPPLNAYERRLVHMTVAEEPGLKTFSVGEGADRRVTIAPADPGAGEA